MLFFLFYFFSGTTSYYNNKFNKIFASINKDYILLKKINFKSICSNPIISNNLIIFVGENGILYSYNIKIDFLSKICQMNEKGNFFICKGINEIFCLNENGKMFIVSLSNVINECIKPAYIHDNYVKNPPVFTNQKVFFIDILENLICLDLKGEFKFKYIPPLIKNENGNYKISVGLNDFFIFFPVSSGIFLKLTQDGDEIFGKSVLNNLIDIKEEKLTLFSPIVFSESIFVCNTTKKSILFDKDGKIIWQHDFGSIVQPVTYKEKILIINEEGFFYGISKTGTIDYFINIQKTLNPKEINHILVGNEHLMIVAKNNIFIFDINTKTLVKKFLNLPNIKYPPYGVEGKVFLFCENGELIILGTPGIE